MPRSRTRTPPCRARRNAPRPTTSRLKRCRSRLFAWLSAAVLAHAGCASVLPYEPALRGETRGSAWTVRIAGALPATGEDVRAGVQSRFEAGDQALSTYRPDSALSRFNEDD